MSKLQQLIDERETISNMTAEDYDTQGYGQYINDTYPFIPPILTLYGLTVQELDKYLSLALITQAIIIYSVSTF